VLQYNATQAVKKWYSLKSLHGWKSWVMAMQEMAAMMLIFNNDCGSWEDFTFLQFIFISGEAPPLESSVKFVVLPDEKWLAMRKFLKLYK